MSQVDERIVDLQFNNKQFETGVQDTLKSLDNLKKGLELEGAGKSLEGIGESASKLGFDFSALEVMAVTALAKITSAVVDFGVQAVKSMALDPIIDGFREYELKMQSVQTIMVNTAAAGTTMADVTKVLDELNDYADQTVFSFSDMTQAISRLTASGVKLEDAAGAIKGISNVTAAVGGNLQNANTAFLQLGQSISSGRLQYQDWRSVMQAGLGGPVLQNELMSIAVAAGAMDQSLMDAVQNGQASFTELIKSSGKAGPQVVFSTEIMLKALNNLAEDPSLLKAATEVKTFTQLMGTLAEQAGSSWAETWEYIIGNKDEAVEMWTAVNNAIEGLIGPMNDGRNATMALWKELGGRDALIEGISNAFNALLKIIEPIKEAFVDIFPPITAERLVELTEKFRDFTANLMINEQTADNIQRTFAGLFAALDLVGMAIKTVFQIAGELLSVFLPMGDGVLGVTASLGDFIVALRDAAIDGNVFGQGVEIISTILDKIKNIINIAANEIKIGIGKIKDYFSQFGGIDLGALKIFGEETIAIFEPFTVLADLFKGAWNIIVTVFQWAAPIIIPFAQQIGQAIAQFANAFGEAVRSGDLQSFISLINTGLLGTVIYGIKNFMSSLTNLSKEGSGVLKGITDILDGVRGSLEAWQTKLKAEALLTIAGAIALLVGSLWILSGIDGESLAASLAGITVLFVELSLMMASISKTTSGINVVKMGAISGQLVAISAAILILSIAMKSISSLKQEEIIQGVVALALLSLVLVKSADSLSKSSPKLITGGIGLIAFSAAILILTEAVEKLGKLNFDYLIQGLGAVGVLMAEIAGFTRIVKPEKLISTGIAMIAMGAALIVIASAVEKLGVLDLPNLTKGLGSIVIILAAFAGFTQIVKPEKLISTGIAMIAIGAGLLVMAQAVSSFGNLDLLNLAQGLIAMSVALAAIAGFSKIVNPATLSASAIALIGVGVALLLIAQAVKSFGGLSWEELAIGLIALAGALFVIAVAANALTGALAGAAAMVIMAAAIMLLVPSLAMLGAMDLVNIGIALLALVGVFAVFGVAGMLLAPLTPVIIGLAAAIALLGIGVLAIGAGLLLFAAGFTALAVSVGAGSAAVVIAITSIINLIPMAIGAVGEGLILFIQIIADATPILMEALTAIVTGLIQVLVSLAPQLVSALFVFLNLVLEAALSYVPKMLDTGLKLIIALLDGLKQHMKEIVVVALELIEEFLRGLADGLPGVVAAAVEIVNALLITIGQETPKLVDAAFKMIIDFVNGLADAIRENTPPLVTAFFNLADAMIEGLVDGLFAGIKVGVDAVKKLGTSIVEGFKDVLGIASPSKVFEEFGEDTVDGYTEGVEEKTPDAEEAVKKMADLAINKAYETFDISSGKSKIFEQLGVTNAESFIAGLNSMGDAIKESLKKVFGADEETLTQMTGIVDEALKTIEDRITSYTDLATDRFNRISTKSETSVAEMITNLKHNQMAIAEWADNIAILVKRGLDEGLLEELRQAGPASAGEVKALVAASDAEIKELNTVMAKGGEVATQALATSVGAGAPVLVAEGQNLVDAIAQGLTSTSSVNDAMSLLISNIKNVGLQGLSPDEFSTIGKNIPEGLSQGISSNTSGVTSALSTMADEAKAVTENEFGINSPSDVYDKYGGNLMEGLAQGITDNSSQPIDAFGEMFTSMETQSATSGQKVSDAAVEGLTINSAVFGQTGTKYGEDFSTAIANTQISALTSGKTVTNRAEEGIKHNASVFGQTGTKYGTDFSTALSNTQTAANTAGRNVAIEAEKGIKSNVEEFRKAGAAAGQGFIDGLKSMVDAAAEAAAELANAAKEAAEKKLDVKSPSRVFQGIGVFSGLGFINGLNSMVSSVSVAAEELGSTAIDGIKDAINRIANVVNQDMDYSPTITPVLDLSNIQNGMKSLNKMLSGTTEVTPIATNVNRIANQMRGEDSIRPANNQVSGETKFEFTQNNYSPKALTRLEIYRQTKNQFAQWKGVADGV